MFSRLFILLLIATLAAVAAAAPSDLEARVAQCNTGTIDCCDSVTTWDDPWAAHVARLLGIVLTSADNLVGLNCDPITVIGTGTGAVCAQQPVCCAQNDFNGLINLGCTPIDLSS